MWQRLKFGTLKNASLQLKKDLMEFCMSAMPWLLSCICSSPLSQSRGCNVPFSKAQPQTDFSGSFMISSSPLPAIYCSPWQADFLLCFALLPPRGGRALQICAGREGLQIHRRQHWASSLPSRLHICLLSPLQADWLWTNSRWASHLCFALPHESGNIAFKNSLQSLTVWHDT